MKKTLRKIIPAIAMLLISATLVGTSTFAWFSMNNKVTISGMSVTTQVSSNLQVAATNAEANYKNSLSQTRSGKLEPVSTTDAENFFYHSTTEHVDGSGDVDDTTWVAYSEAVVADPSNALDNSAAGKTNYDKAFNDNYGFDATNTANVVYGYIDYTFFLKATSTTDNQVLKMTECYILYNGNAITEKAWRVAVFSQTSAKDTATEGIGTKLTILAPEGAVNFESGNAVTSTSARGAVTYGTAAVLDNDVDIGDHYYKVVVRLWLEGDDTTCNNTTFATLTNAWTLSLGFELAANNTNAVTNVGTYGATASGATATASIAGFGAGSTYAWFDASNDSDLATSTATYTVDAGSKTVYCKITAPNGEVYQTSSVTVTAD